MLKGAAHRTSLRTTLSVIAIAGFQSWGTPARAAEPETDHVPRLAELVRATDPWEIGALVGAEPGFAALGTDDRRRLLATLEEPVKLWAPLLNLYPGYGIGSMAEGDRRGVWVAGIEGVATIGFMVGLARTTADSFTETPEQRQRRVQEGRAIALTSLGVLAVTRAISISLPFTFRGSRHASLDRALSRQAPSGPHITAWIAPVPDGRDRALQAGATVVF